MPFSFFSAEDQGRQTCPHCNKQGKATVDARIETSALTDLAYIAHLNAAKQQQSERLKEIRTHYPIFQLYFSHLQNLHENDPTYLQNPDARSCKILIIGKGNSINTQTLLSFASAGSFHHCVCICTPNGADPKINVWHTACLLTAMTESSSPIRQRLASVTSLFKKGETRTATASSVALDDLLFFFFNLPAHSVVQPDTKQPLTFKQFHAHLPPTAEPQVRLRRASAAAAATTTSSTAYTYRASQYSYDDELGSSSLPVDRTTTPPSDAALRQSLLFRENEYTEVVAGPQCPYCYAPVMHSFLQTPGKKVYGNVSSLDTQLASQPEFSEIIKRPLIRLRDKITEEILSNIVVYDFPSSLPLAEFGNRIHTSYPKFGNNDILVGIQHDRSLAWIHTCCFQTTHHKESVLYSALNVVESDMEPLPPIPSAPMPKPPSPPAAAAAASSDRIVYAELDFAPTGYLKIVRFLSNS